ncbi:MAG: protein-L-isoaspartate(D-aspartate) O-methyltransferase [Bacteroidetes bacterium]|nr:protein-L-isoaspartate(D-aspartate) O-methyltransferase [Bacteroidota bacterium]
MVELLRSRGISNETVLEAMAKVERHRFVNQTFIDNAYKDIALPINSDQTISQPYTVAFMTQALEPKKEMKVLEIGTGSGYQAAVLATIGCRVYSVERHLSLVTSARKIFDQLKLRILVKAGDGTIGWGEFAPYDGIIVTAGSPSMPEPLVNQLAEGGRIVIPIGTKSNQQIVVGKKNKDTLHTTVYDGFKFVPLIGKSGWN